MHFLAVKILREALGKTSSFARSALECGRLRPLWYRVS